MLMKKMKVIVGLIVLIMAISMVGCGEQGDSGDNTDISGNGESTEMVMPEDKGECKEFENFETLDIDGNKVSNEIFADYNYTIVDVWGTYCNPCIKAMPEMEEVYQEYKDKGVNVVGLVIDVQNSDLSPNMERIALAKSITEKQGSTFKHLIVPVNIFEGFMMQVEAIPTQVLVDKEGKLASDLKVGGLRPEDWKKIIDEKLSKEK